MKKFTFPILFNKNYFYFLILINPVDLDQIAKEGP